MAELSITCPECGAQILFDAQALLTGETLACKGCDVKISITPGGEETVKDAIEQFANLKAKALAQKKDR